MPNLDASIIPANLSGQVQWKLLMEYKRAPANESTTYTRTKNANEHWVIDFDGCYGGTFTLSATYAGQTKKLVFYVRGTNPLVPAVKAFIGNNPYYAIAIAAQESNFAQFNTAGTHGPNWTDIKGCPNLSSDHKGWGIYQITDDSNMTPNARWNWKFNVSLGLNLMALNITRATKWINSQKAQQMRQDPSKPLVNFPFTYAKTTYQEGTSHTPIDACAIEAFNGATPGWAIYWQNKTAPYTWLNRDNINDYIAAISSRL